MSIKLNKPKFASLLSLTLYFLIINKQLPFLHDGTVLSGGKEVPTEEFVQLISPMFLYMVPAFLIVGVINFYVLKNRARKN